MTETTFYRWRTKFGNMSVSEAQCLQELESENARLKRLLPNATWKWTRSKRTWQKSPEPGC